MINNTKILATDSTEDTEKNLTTESTEKKNRMKIQNKMVANGARWLFWGWLIIVLAMNVIPLGNDLNRIIHKPIYEFRLDYLIHFVSFLVFIPLYLIGERQGNPIFNHKPVLRYILIVGGSAIISECLQYLLPYRTFNPMDMIANLFGAILTLLFIFISHRRHQEHRKVIYNTKILAADSTEDTEK